LAHSAMIDDGGNKFNSRLWSLVMRNKFGDNWSEQTKVDVTTQGDKIDNKQIQIEIIRNKKEDE